PKMVMIQNRVEHQPITSDCLAAVYRVVGEEQHRTLTEVRVDNDCVLRNRSALVEQSIEQQGLRVRKAQDHFGSKLEGNDQWIVANLFFIQFLSFPWLLFFKSLSVSDLTAE